MLRKQLIVIGAILVTNLIYGKIIVPPEVKTEISQYAVERGEDDKAGFTKWQIDAYISIEDELEKSKLPEEEKTLIRKRLKAKYGSNYARQSKSLKEEMNIVPVLNKEIKVAQDEIKRNEESKKELKNIVQENKEKIPKKYMDQFQAESIRLYPDSPYEQKKYMEQAVNIYKMIINTK